MIRAAVVDDYASDAKALCACLARFTEACHVDVVIECFPSAEDLLDRYARQFDVVFLDIEMPGTDGLAAARSLRSMDERTTLVFVTNLAHLAIEGYGVDALDFLVKPVDYYSVEMVMRKMLSRMRRPRRQTVTVTTRGGLRVVPLEKIDYIEVREHHVTYHTTEGELTVRGSLDEVERQLGQSQFLRCNRWCLVNVERISRIEGGRAFVGTATLEVSRSNRRRLAEAVTELSGGSFDA